MQNSMQRGILKTTEKDKETKRNRRSNMKLMHLSDLHLGKRVNGFSMLEEQREQ